MAFGSFNPQRQQSMLSEINVTPMVDVMLVLLIIFILTAPLLTQGVKLELPKAVAPHSSPATSAIRIAIDAEGGVHWNDEKVSMAQLEERVSSAGKVTPAPEVQLRADKNTRYEVLAQVMAAAQAQGLTRISFITEPNKENTHGKR